MKHNLFIIIFFLFNSNINAQKNELRLYDCETTSLITLKNGTLNFKNNLIKPLKFEFKLSKSDIEKINFEIKNILKIKGNEVWENYCIDDGNNMKFKILNKNKIIKKVFVGNYMDRRLNKIVIIINNYLKQIKSSSILTLSYGYENEKDILKEIDEQNNCPMISSEEHKKSMLNSWCEF